MEKLKIKAKEYYNQAYMLYEKNTNLNNLLNKANK